MCSSFKHWSIALRAIHWHRYGAMADVAEIVLCLGLNHEEASIYINAHAVPIMHAIWGYIGYSLGQTT